VIGGLLATWVACFAAGVWVGVPTDEGTRRLPRPARHVMMCIHLVMGLYWLLAAAHGTSAWPYGLWIAGGLVFGALGDLALARTLPLGRHWEIGGVALFAMGHLLYAAAILTLRTAWPGASFSWLAGLLGAAIAVATWLFLVNSPERGILNIASLLYGMLLLALAGLAVGLTASHLGMWSLSSGLILFAVSDLILSQAMVRRRNIRSILDLVWLVYGLAQMFIAASIGEAAMLLR
jgi:hypothetical protein